MQVDDRELQIGGRRHRRLMQEKVAKIEIAMIDPATMHPFCHLGNPSDQRALQRQRGGCTGQSRQKSSRLIVGANASVTMNE